jgi:DmsE family decaheme c-type cytochrome
MCESVRSRLRAIQLACWVASWLALTGAASAAPQSAQPQGASEKTYAGESTCAVCHLVQAEAFHKTPHGQAWRPGSPAAEQACESCHGPGQAHIDGGGDVTKIRGFRSGTSAQDIDQTCLTCHEKATIEEYPSSKHARQNVSCATCHSVHSYKSAAAQLKTVTDSETCYGCHKSERAKTLRSSHHPIREGKIGCSSCHNPHDGSRPYQIRAESINELCYTCHTEKRGPFLWEHAAVREDCSNCHDPHGSNHERLLVARQPFLCQRCHYSGHGITADNWNTLQGVQVAPPGSTATISVRNIEDGCKDCHWSIHGSNSPSGARFNR